MPVVFLLAALICGAIELSLTFPAAASDDSKLEVIDKTTSYIVSIDDQTPQEAPQSQAENTADSYSDCGGNEVKESETAAELFEFQKCFLAGSL